VSQPAIGSGQKETGFDRRGNALAILLALAVLGVFASRILVSNSLMNLVMEYTTEFGSFYEKIHLGTYAIFLLLPVALLSRPFVLQGHDIERFRDTLRFALLLVLLIGLMMAIGRTSAGGLFLDTYLVAAAAALIMLAMVPSARRFVGESLLVLNIVSAMMGVAEFAMRRHFLPTDLDELIFRPTGLSGHPLNLGMISGASIAFVTLTSWKPWQKLVAMLLLLIGTAAAGARLSLVVTALEIMALIVFVPWGLSPRSERKAKLAALLMVLIGGAGLFAILAAGGALQRFEGGIVDENFFARTDIYSIFGMVSWQQIVFGADLNVILKLVNERLGLPFIESSPVYMTFLVGAPLAIGVFGLLFWYLWRLLRHAPRAAWIGTIAFLLAALSNNTVTTRTPVLVLFVVLILAFAPGRPSQPK